MAQPDYDFFVRPGESPSAGQFGGGGATDSRFGAGPVAPAGQFGAPAPAGQFGAPAADHQYAAGPASAYPTPPVAWAPPGASPGAARRGVPGWLIAIIVLVVPLPVVLTVASVVLPVYLNQQGAHWKSHQLVLPGTLDGSALTTSAGSNATVQKMVDATQGRFDAEKPGVYTIQGAAYGRDLQHGLIVLTAHPNRSLTATEQGLARTRNLANAKQAGITLTSQPAGPLGGSLSCGRSTVITECIVVDPVGQIVITMAPGVPYGRALAIRAAVEIRR